ncbi:hypothetical protein Tco_0539317 [Tanacetum coccineum]
MTEFNKIQEQVIMDFQNEMNCLKKMLNLTNSNQDPPVDLYDLKGSDEGDNKINSLTKEPLYTLLMGDEVISTILKRENDEFIKSSVDDLVLIPRKSEVTSVCDDLECNMPMNTPLPTTDVREEDFDINSPIGAQVVDFLMGGHPNTFHYSYSDESDEDEPSEVFQVQKSIYPLSGSPTPSFDSIIESLSPSLTPCGDSDLLLEETDEFLSLDNSIPPSIDNGIYDSEGDILFLEGLLNDEILRDLPPFELNNDLEGDILFLEKLLEDDPLEAKNSKIDSFIRESTDTFFNGGYGNKIQSS